MTRVEDVTQAPEMLGGRVKTLHPRIHGGILARRDRADDIAALAEQEIEPFDLVVVNFYPFASAIAQQSMREEDAIEMIDIGGPSMLRAAAKNFEHVAPVSSPAQYEAVLDELRSDAALSPRDAPQARRRGVRDDGARTSPRSRRGSRTTESFPRA